MDRESGEKHMISLRIQIDDTPRILHETFVQTPGDRFLELDRVFVGFLFVELFINLVQQLLMNRNIRLLERIVLCLVGCKREGIIVLDLDYILRMTQL